MFQLSFNTNVTQKYYKKRDEQKIKDFKWFSMYLLDC